MKIVHSACICFILFFQKFFLIFLQSLGKKQEKRPKTIHRCILQKMTSLDSNSLAKRINCHVCGEAYATYKCYLDHLLDKSCERTQNRRQQHTVSSFKVHGGMCTTRYPENGYMYTIGIKKI